MIDAIDKELFLALPPADAFRLFTERISDWWPPDRRHTGDASSSIAMLSTGRFFERAADGREVELGLVRTWVPGHKLVLDFYIPSGPDHPTELTITFSPEAGGTRLILHHEPTPKGRETWERFAPRFVASWDRVLACLEAGARSL